MILCSFWRILNPIKRKSNVVGVASLGEATSVFISNIGATGELGL